MAELIFENRNKTTTLSIKSMHCPKCGYKILSRIKRTNTQRLLSYVLFDSNLKRYSCARCDWKGLKYARQELSADVC